jgi:GT2 family glycosyltransferase
LELTKKCVASVRAQDVPTETVIVDNASTDGTEEWIYDTRTGFEYLWQAPYNRGVSWGWNIALKYMFGRGDVEHVLVVNNDTILPPWFYYTLLSYDLPFVTGISVDNIDEIAYPSQWAEPGECPDFSAFLIRRDAWELIGPFDEGMVHYASDIDYHIRAKKLGIPLLNSGVPFYHERSSTLKLANPVEKRQIELQADADREYFAKKHGFTVEEA